MLSSMYFDELDPIRKEIQGDLMGKVDCVMEACRESYDKGISKGISQGISQGARDIAKKLLLSTDLSCEDIAENTGLSLDEIITIKNNI